jgi:hypothetical protein
LAGQVLSFLPEIACRLILKELESNVQYHHNLSNSRDLQKLATLCSLFGLSIEEALIHAETRIKQAFREGKLKHAPEV